MLEFTLVKVNISRSLQDLRKPYIGINLNKIFNVKILLNIRKYPKILKV